MSDSLFADAITAFPPIGPTYVSWEQRIIQARAAALEELGELCPELEVQDFFSVSSKTQGQILMTPEYCQWSFWMKQRLLWKQFEADGPSADKLVRQFHYFLLAAYLREPRRVPVSLDVPLIDECFVPLISTAWFLKLLIDKPANQRQCRCVLDGPTLACEGSGKFSTSVLERPGETTPTFTLRGLPRGMYRLPMLANQSTVLGLPVSTYYKTCLRGMSGIAEETEHLRYPTEVQAIWRDISDAVALLSETWPELSLAFSLHAKVVVPLESDTVLSYTESATSNVLFVRARPMNPLWYLELLIHECAHTWLASLMELFQFVEDGDHATHSSPWRVDKRPMQGILFATHAFAIVTIALASQLGSGVIDASVLARRIMFESNRVGRGYRILLKHGSFTPHGRILVESLGTLVDEAARRAADCALTHPKGLDTSIDRIWPTAQ